MKRTTCWILAALMGIWMMLPASAQTVISNNAADMANHIVMVADSSIPRTVTNLFTFNRGAAVPFAVGASSLKVTNLDADKLDGLDSTTFADATNLTTGTLPDARLSSTVANVNATETITGAWSFTSAVPVFSVKPTISAGLQFPATQATSADANTLDDYEEGTFTPALQFGGAAVGMTGTQTGTYVKIGQNVCTSIRITLTAKGSSTGQALITNLPFTSSNTTYGGLSLVYVANLSTSVSNILGYIATSSSTVTLTYIAAGGSTTAANVTDTVFSGTTDLIMAGCYRASA